MLIKPLNHLRKFDFKLFLSMKSLFLDLIISLLRSYLKLGLSLAEDLLRVYYDDSYFASCSVLDIT